jgi:hypothetical protein
LHISLYSPALARGRLSACYEEYNAANERYRARDGGQWHIVGLFPGGVKRSDVNQLFRGGICKTSPRKTEQAKHNQDDPKRFVHAASFGGGSYLQPPLTKGEQSGTQSPARYSLVMDRPKSILRPFSCLY